MDKNVRHSLAKWQSIDPLGAASEITGTHYKDDETTDTSVIGLLLAHEKNNTLRAICSEHDDIYYDLDIENCLRILKEEGFEVMGEQLKLSNDHSRKRIAFSNNFHQKKDGSRTWTVWHPAFQLLGSIDSFMRSDGYEKLNHLGFAGQFTHPDENFQKFEHQIITQPWSGITRVRRHDLADVMVRSWSIRNGLRQFMANLAGSGMVPVDQWVNQWSERDNDAAKNLPENIRAIVGANVDALLVTELKHYGK